MKTVDVRFDSSLAMKYGIRRVPTFVMTFEGEELRRMGGTSSPERLKMLWRKPLF